jgi:hypothetical protein
VFRAKFATHAATPATTLATSSWPLGGWSKTGTIIDRALRAAGPLSVGKQGTAGARMTTRDAVNLLLANLIERQRGESVVDNVRRVRDLRHDEHPMSVPADYSSNLPFFHAVTAGESLRNAISTNC